MTVKQEAKRLAEETLDANWSGDLPVDPFGIADDLGISVFSASIGSDVSGMLRKLPGRGPEIILDVSEALVRRRFSCAHEIGHFVRHAGSDEELAFVDYRGPAARNGTDLEEVFANNFAANLLMPQAAVEALAELDLSAIQMAGIFDVSLDAMTFRLKNLRLAS
ncbi:ImmA/IrrE family metallo-endopeptidase [Rathayibacter sp. VKM Ac-2835]|uniref:ImmA/IrrE family metallo-endopeptidase n=1 Tax=Rathayibacter sp. VKM Ac-2835 TaxID=2739043 RepID=UPI001C2707E4